MEQKNAGRRITLHLLAFIIFILIISKYFYFYYSY